MAGMYGQISGAEAFSDPKTSPVYNWKQYERYFYPAANAYRNFTKVGGEQDQLYNQYKNAYLSPDAQAQAAANAKIYQDYAKGLFANQPNQFSNYQQVGDYLYGKLDQFALNTANAGNRAMNDRAAALGLGGQGTNSYLAKINADRITNNLAPVFANTTNAIGRDYGAINQNQLADIGLRLGMAQGDVLGNYANNVYERPLDVAYTRAGQIANNTRNYNDLANAFKTNIAGYETKETNDIARFGRPFDTWASSYSMYGNGQNQPSTNPYQGFQPSNYMNQAQDNRWLSEYYGTAGNPYLGQVSPYAGGGLNNYPLNANTSGPLLDAGSNFNNPYIAALG